MSSCDWWGIPVWQLSVWLTYSSVLYAPHQMLKNLFQHRLRSYSCHKIINNFYFWAYYFIMSKYEKWFPPRQSSILFMINSLKSNVLKSFDWNLVAKFNIFWPKLSYKNSNPSLFSLPISIERLNKNAAQWMSIMIPFI